MLALFTFIATWTDFFWHFIVLDARNPTLPVALKLLQANYFVDYSVVLAGALLATAPLLILFAVAGKQLVSRRRCSVRLRSLRLAVLGVASG